MPTATADVSVGASAGADADVSTRRSLIDRWRSRCCRPVASGSYTAFRVAFGLVIVWSTFRFVARGWVQDFYLAPGNHLTYAGFEWVRPFPTALMYAHMAMLVVLGIAITVGYRTRLAAGLFALGFAYVELIDAALYLNHYWFVTLAAVTLAILPGPIERTVPAATVWVLRAQVAVVYVFAGIAKLNPDWLFDAQPMQLWLAARTDRPIVGPWLDEPAVAFAFSWAGALFDLTIVGWLLWWRSRPLAYVAVVVFHIATATLFQIGVFPWVMIALTPIYFAPDWPSALRRWLRGTPTSITKVDVEPSLRSSPRIGRPAAVALVVLTAANIMLPLRHYAAEGNVRFNDDGYYLSWRVMLSERTGFVQYVVRDPTTGETRTVRPDSVLADWQVAQATQRPDLILATAHLIAEHSSTIDGTGVGDRGVEVFADAWVAFNGRPRQRWIDPDVDLAALDRDAPAHRYVLDLESTPR